MDRLWARTHEGQVLGPQPHIIRLEAQGKQSPWGPVVLMNTRPQLKEAGLEKHCEF